jgi:hypothetical protein
MKWITQGKVKAAAKTEERAKKCSEHHWWQLWNCTHEELKKKVRQYESEQFRFNNAIISTTFCAFCVRHFDLHPCRKNGICALKKTKNCCKEYEDARDAYYDWYDDKTLANFIEFQVKAEIMWKKIKNLKIAL